MQVKYIQVKINSNKKFGKFGKIEKFKTRKSWINSPESTNQEKE
jgi:hypothetical protein